jgi:lipoprotein-anchoring transpeptidase ErfK/SrfK
MSRLSILCLFGGVLGSLTLGAQTVRAQYYAPAPAYPPYDYSEPEPDPVYRPQPRSGSRLDQDYDAQDRLYDRPAVRERSARLRPGATPSDADPNYSSPVDYDDEVDFRQTTATLVNDPTGEQGGGITIDTARRKLYLSLGDGQAIEYGIGVGREGFAWKGTAQVGRKAFWPGWTPPREMLLRRPDLPSHMEGGLDNPLGARALYLFKGPKDTMFRIHGTNEPETIGHAVSSGCIRMLNADVIDLYRRVKKGVRVVVM